MLSPEVLHKLESIERRFEELTHHLSDPAVASSGERFKKVSKERAGLEPTVTALRAWRALQAEIADNEAMLAEKDEGIREMAKEELAALRPRVEPTEEQLKIFLIPTRPQRRQGRHRGDPGRSRRRRGRPLRRRDAAHVPALRRAPRLEVARCSTSRAATLGGVKDATVTISGDAVYSLAQVRVGRAPGAARAGHRGPGAHPHLHRHRGGDARGRGRRHPDQPRRPRDAT